MTNPMRHLAAVTANVESATRAGEFVAVARYIAAAKGDRLKAQVMAEAAHASPRVQQILKSAVSAGSLSDANWAAPLGEFQVAISAFIDSLRHVSVFDRMLADMRRVPLRTRIAVTTLGATGSAVTEGHVKLLSSLALAGKQLEQEKALAIIAATDELLRASGADGSNLFGRELRSAVAMATDQRFLEILTTGISPIPSGGGTAVDIRTDLSAALAAIDTDSASRLFVIVESSTAKFWATKVDANGGAAFPEMTPTGGFACGMPVLVADGLPSQTIVVVDANQIAAGAGTVELDVAQHATLQFESAPDSPPAAATVFKNLWQHDMAALKAERYFGAERLRDTAVAVIEGVSYSGNSPN